MFKGKNKKFLLLIIFLLISISIGYAVLNSNISIKGKSNISKNVWDIHLDNVQLKKGSATSNLPEIINNETIVINATLNNPGDYYSFTFDVVNAGTLNAIIENIELESNITKEQYNLIRYEMFYDDGAPYDSKQYLMAGETKKLRVVIEYISEILPENLPDEISDFSIVCRMVYSQIEKYPDAYIQATRVSWNQTPGVTLYDAINTMKAEAKPQSGTYPRATEFNVVHPDITHAFVNENGRILNLLNTVVESGKMYQSTFFGIGSKVSDDKLRNDDYVTVFVNATDILLNSFLNIKIAECENVPVFVGISDTYVNVMHAIYPNGYAFGTAEAVEAFEQELFADEYVLGFPAGQNAGGCENGTVHKFFVFMDEDDNLFKMTNKVNHMDKCKVKIISIDESEMTWEEAKTAVLNELNTFIDKNN